MSPDPVSRLYAFADTRVGTVALHLAAWLCLVVLVSVQWPYRDGFDVAEWLGSTSLIVLLAVGVRTTYRSVRRERELHALRARTAESEVADELADAGFLRIHKRYLVNAALVRVVKGKSVRVGAEALPIGRAYVQAVRRRLGIGG